MANEKMRARLSALMRKAGISEAAPDATVLMDTLLRRLHTKRDYEDALGTPEDADRVARACALPASQHHMLLELQNQKDIFTPNPLLDFILTVLFVAEIALIGWAMVDRGVMWLFVLLLVLIDCIIRRVKGASEIAGLWLSSKVVAWGCIDAEPLNGRVQFKKWQEQSWQLFIHIAASCAEVAILREETWWDAPATCWIPHPLEQRGKVRTDLQILYLTQLAVWFYTCFIHRFVDERRKDYFVMYLHHIVTIALVGVSWANDYLRIGLLVLYVHDVSDIFVDLLKLMNYLKLEGPRCFFVTEIGYIATVTGWVYWRLYQFPFRVINGSFALPLQVLAKHPREAVHVLGVEVFPPDLFLYTEMNVLLIALLVLHVYWFHLFAMIGYRILTENVREASRQEYEGDSDDDVHAEAAEGSSSIADAAKDGTSSPVGHDEGAGNTAPAEGTLRARKGASAAAPQ